MRILIKLVAPFIANAAGIFLAAYWVPGFRLAGGFSNLDYRALAITIIIFTFLNAIIKPILKLLLGPFILLTLGIGTFAVNALLLFLLDYFSETLMIEAIPALLGATLIVGVANFITHLFIR